MNSIKKIMLTLMMVLVCAGAASAQFRFGIKAGLNVNSLHFNKDLFESDNQCGFTAGVMTEFTVPLVGLCFDLSAMYTRMNAQAEIDAPGVDKEGSVGKNFLQIPLNIKYKFQIPVVASIIKPYIFTGPELSVKLDNKTWENLKTKTCQWAWNVGIGVELIKHLQVSGSYGFGMNNVVKSFTGANASDMDLKNNYWTVTAAWLF